MTYSASSISHRVSSIEYPGSIIQLWNILPLITLILIAGTCFGELTPLDLLQNQERQHKNQKGEVCLGEVMTLNYTAEAVEPGKEYHPLLLELTDILKTPIRQSYRLVLKGYSDPGETTDSDVRLSAERAESLKTMLVSTYGLEESRISAEGLGSTNPVSANEMQENGRLNGGIQIQVYGNVSEAVRFMECEAGK